MDQNSAKGDSSDRPDENLIAFYISASASLAQLGVQVLKQGDTFAVFNHFGDVLSWQQSPEGLFHNDTRHLSRFDFQFDGHRPLLLSSNIQDDNAVLTVDLTNPDIYQDGRLRLAKDTIHFLRSKFLWQGVCYERIGIRNYGSNPHHLRLSLRFEADFADLFEVRGHRRSHTGERSAEKLSDTAVALCYDGLDGIRRETVLSFDPAPAELDVSGARFDLAVEPGGRAVLFVVVSCAADGRGDLSRRNFFVCLREARRAQRKSARDAATVETSDSGFNELLCRSASDLYMLLSSTDHGPYPHAGIPWFSAPFGRDGIITAMQMLWVDPAIAKGVLGFLAATQATEVNDAADAEPGKILHEMRRGEMALLGEVPFRQYYGSVDATPLFVILAGQYFERTGDVQTITALWPQIAAALNWIDEYGDADNDGFLEYHRRNADGLVNQGWKDSHDSIFHADGRAATGPIAMCEVQAYVYAAKRLAASMARALGMAAQAVTWDTQATALRGRFNDIFWCEELSTYALALDGDKQPCRVRASNAGHALFAGIVSQERAERVAASLTARDGFSGWGIRTVARSEARYNPMSYHNGSVWPHDNALIALGFARYGLKEAVGQVLGGLFEASAYFEQRRLPELLCGFLRRQRKGPTNYPVACSPQAWASAAPFALLQACMGLELDHRANDIRFVSPWLPEYLEEVHIRGLTMGETTVDVMLRRHESDVAVTVLNRTGNARVVAIS